MKLRTAVIGINGYGRTHYSALAQLARDGELDLACAVIRNPEKSADLAADLQELGCRIYPSDQEMYEQEAGRLDLVTIPTGIAAHRPMAERALAAGANVLLEKPAAGCIDDVSAMIAAERKSDRLFCAVAFQHMYAPEVQRIKQLVCSGALGALRRISAMGIWPRGASYYRRNNWAGKLYGAAGEAVFDSPFNNAFAHYLNLALFWAGERFDKTASPHRVQAELYRGRPELDSFDSGMVRMTTGTGTEIMLFFSHCTSDTIEPELRVECERGTVFWRNCAQWRVELADGSVPECGVAEHPHMHMFHAVVNRLRNQEEFVYSLENAAQHTRFIETLHRLVPIAPIPDQFRHAGDGEEPIGISGLADAIRRGFAENRLPSELNFSWACRPVDFSLAESFPKQ